MSPAPSAEPIRKQFCDLLVARLRTSITRANGFYIDVKSESVQQDEINVLNLPDSLLPFFLVQPTERGTFTFEPANQLKEEFYVAVTMRMDAVGTAADRKTTIQERLIADFERAIASVNGADIWWDPLPISDVRPQKAVPLQSPGVDQVVIVIVPILVWIHRTFGQP
jgi:hypothetical protein